MLLILFAKGLTDHQPQVPLLAEGSLPTDSLWQGPLMGRGVRAVMPLPSRERTNAEAAQA